MAIIVEVLGWGGKSRRHYRVASDSISVGRGYDNDIVLADSYVSANHLQLVATDKGWSIEDLNSRNGLQVIKKVGDTEQVFESGSEIKIGRTRLRIVAEHQPVDEAKVLHRLEQETGKLSQWRIWLPLFFVTLIIEFGSIYTNTIIEWEWEKAIPLLVGLQLMIVVLSLFWAMMGRIFRHEAHFLGHYSLILIASLMFSVSGVALAVLDYNFSGLFFTRFLEYLVLILVVFFLLSANLALASNLSTRARWLSAGGFVATLGLIVLSVEMISWGEFSPLPEYSSKLEPPALLVRDGQSNEEFLVAMDHLFAAADNNKK
jgi:hypothetical protein